MTAAARRLRVVPIAPRLPKRKPGTWGPLAPPVDVRSSEYRAAWASYLTRDGQRFHPSEITDLRGLARAIRCTR